MRSRFLFCGLLVAASCTSSSPDLGVVSNTEPAPTVASTTTSTTTAPSTTVPAPVIEQTGCESAPDDHTDCFALTLPANRDDASHGSVTLPVIVLRATGPAPKQAVVIPGGGPGFTETGNASYWATHAIRTDHDIVLYDQRGTGNAEPSLECPERDEEVMKSLQSAEEPPNDRFAISEAALVCQARLAAAGIDFGDYDTAASATDLDDLRAALGYDRWTILGISYGSRLALESMRSHPEGLTSVILDSVYDVTAGGLADSVASGERAIALVDAKYPGFDESLNAARELFDTAPWVGDVDLGDGNGPQQFMITGDDLVGGVFSALYDRSVIPSLPGIVQALANGDGSIIPTMLQRAQGSLTGAADAMQLSVDCADNAGLGEERDDATREDPGRMALPVALAGPPCAEWDVPPTRADFNQPVVSDVPALVLAGEFDPITPSDRTKAVADRLPNSTYYFFPGFGHGVTGNDLCATAIENQFLADASAPIIDTCLSGA